MGLWPRPTARERQLPPRQQPLRPSGWRALDRWTLPKRETLLTKSHTELPFYSLDLLRYQRHDHAAVFCAFDLLEHDGRDFRRRSIEKRKAVLAKLLSGSREGIAFNQHY